MLESPAIFFTYISLSVKLREIGSPVREIGRFPVNCGSLPPNAGDLTCLRMSLLVNSWQTHCMRLSVNSWCPHVFLCQQLTMSPAGNNTVIIKLCVYLSTVENMIAHVLIYHQLRMCLPDKCQQLTILLYEFISQQFIMLSYVFICWQCHVIFGSVMCQCHDVFINQ